MTCSNLVDDELYAHRNRYSDMFVYDKSKVTLKTGVTKENLLDNYINANYVNTPFMKVNDDLTTSTMYGDSKIIATQGPLEDTVEDFWQMVMENNVTLIITCCRLNENGR